MGFAAARRVAGSPAAGAYHAWGIDHAVTGGSASWGALSFQPKRPVEAGVPIVGAGQGGWHTAGSSACPELRVVLFLRFTARGPVLAGGLRAFGPLKDGRHPPESARFLPPRLPAGNVGPSFNSPKPWLIPSTALQDLCPQRAGVACAWLPPCWPALSRPIWPAPFLAVGWRSMAARRPPRPP